MDRIHFIQGNLLAGTNIITKVYSGVGNIMLTVFTIALVGFIIYRFFLPQELPSTTAKILSCECKTRNFEHAEATAIMNRCHLQIEYSIDNKTYINEMEIDSDRYYHDLKEIDIIYNKYNPYDIKLKIMQTRSWMYIISAVSIIISAISLSIWWISQFKDMGVKFYKEIMNYLEK